MNDQEGILAAILGDPLSGIHTRNDFPTTRSVQVCDRIEPERELAGGAKFEKPLAERWRTLTRPLPLAGVDAMRLSRTGSFAALDLLRAEMPWGSAIIDPVERQLRMQLAAGRSWVKLEPMLLVGPPGIGKTWIAQRLGHALKLASATLSFGNLSDDRALSGTARGWTNTFPSWPVVMIAQSRTANPMLVLDEIDKAGGSARNGRPLEALLSMLEPESARRWLDPCLLGECDLRHLNWIACANSTARLSPALLSRFQVVELERPSPEHFDAVFTGVTRAFARDLELSPAQLPDLPARALDLLRRRFLQNRSIRALARDARALLGAALADKGGGRQH